MRSATAAARWSHRLAPGARRPGNHPGV